MPLVLLVCLPLIGFTASFIYFEIKFIPKWLFNEGFTRNWPTYRQRFLSERNVDSEILVDD